MKEIELNANHSHWMMTSYNYYVIADHNADNRITDEERNERYKWCLENIGKPIRLRNCHTWCCSSQVNKSGNCPYWVFYFVNEEDALAFKLRWK